MFPSGNLNFRMETNQIISFNQDKKYQTSLWNESPDLSPIAARGYKCQNF